MTGVVGHPLRSALAGVLGLALLAGCASIPTRTASHVVQHIDPSDPKRELGTQREVSPPTGALPAALVSAFMVSLAGWQNGHRSPREFLTQEARQEWQDEDQVVVTLDPPVVTRVDKDNVVTVTYKPVGLVARDGSYEVATGHATDPVNLQFRLVRNADGEWRIGLPFPMPGVVLPYSDFEQFYTAHTVYYLEPSGSRLVPDVRYLPNDPQHLAQQLARLVFEAPSGWLAPMVVNSLAPLRLNRLDLDGERHVIRVDLGGLNPQQADVRGALAQLVYTLGAVPAPISYNASLYAVVVTSDGRAIPDIGTNPARPADLPGYDPEALPDGQAGGIVEAYYVRDGAVYSLDSKRQIVDQRYGLTAVGVSTDLNQLAGVGPRLDGHGQTLWLGRMPAAKAGPATLRASRLMASTLTRPTWDRATGDFWTVANGRFIWRIASADGEMRPVRLAGPLLDDPSAGIGALRLARDGTRVAFTAGRTGHRLLYVGRVRSAGGKGGQVTIEQPIPVVPNLVDVTDVAWEQPTELLVLGRTAGGEQLVERISSDGATIQPNALELPLTSAGASTITGAPHGRHPVLSTRGGVLQSSNRGWANIAAGEDSLGKPLHGTAPTYPG